MLDIKKRLNLSQIITEVDNERVVAKNVGNLYLEHLKATAVRDSNNEKFRS